MKRIFFILTALLFISGVQAQKETNIWHFGYNGGLDFNQPVSSVAGVDWWWNGSGWTTAAATVLKVPRAIKGYVYTHEGCFTLSDENGKLMMSSDGITIYNKNGGLMQNGNALGGDPSATQSGIIIPKPSSPNIFYAVCVNSERKAPIQYAEIDMTLNGNLGAVVSKNNILTTFNCDENIAAVPHANGVDYWLINRTINTYYVWLLSSSGFTYKGSAPTGSTLTYTGDFPGELIVSPDGAKIVALTYCRTQILTAEFNTSTGAITNPKVPYIGPPNSGYGLYGGCFSPNSQYFYFSHFNDSGYTHASYCASWSGMRNESPLVWNTMLPAVNYRRGSDGKIYGIRVESRDLLVIENPDAGDLHTKFIANYLLASTSARVGLPTFLSSYLKTNFNVFPLACNQNAREVTVEITSGGASPATKIDWDFGDGTTVLGQPITPNTTQTYRQIHTYATPGNKTITITPRAADNTAKPSKSFQLEVIPCAIKTNRMIRTNLKDQGEP